MNKKILGAVLGLGVLMASAAASAHVNVAVGIGVPGAYVAPQPAYVVNGDYGYGYHDGWRERERRREWRHEQWRHERWHEHHGYGRY
jgi:hypothetical protein